MRSRIQYFEGELLKRRGKEESPSLHIGFPHPPRTVLPEQINLKEALALIDFLSHELRLRRTLS